MKNLRARCLALKWMKVWLRATVMRIIRSWSYLQTNRRRICCLFKWETALVEVNQLRMQSAEVATRLCEACQDVKVFFQQASAESVLSRCKPNLSLLTDSHCKPNAQVTCAQVGLVALRPMSQREEHVESRSAWVFLQCMYSFWDTRRQKRAFSPCRDSNDATFERLFWRSNKSWENHMVNFNPQDHFPHI